MNMSENIQLNIQEDLLPSKVTLHVRESGRGWGVGL